MTISARDWIDRYAAALGVAAPTEEEVATLLDAAGVASHASERTAAPVSCWLAATAGLGRVAPGGGAGRRRRPRRLVARGEL